MTVKTERTESERQRLEHLVHGRPRPKPSVTKKSRKRAPRPMSLVAGVEAGVRLREAWSHKQGTPETHEHAYQASKRPGSLARLLASGAIDADQHAAAEGIEGAYRLITAGVSVKIASLEARVDGGRHGRAEELKLGRVHVEFAYTWWRAAVGCRADALLEVIVHDVGLTIVARRLGISMPRARRMLTDGLDLWHVGRSKTIAQAQAAIAS